MENNKKIKQKKKDIVIVFIILISITGVNLYIIQHYHSEVDSNYYSLVPKNDPNYAPRLLIVALEKNFTIDYEYVSLYTESGSFIFNTPLVCFKLTNGKYLHWANFTDWIPNETSYNLHYFVMFGYRSWNSPILGLDDNGAFYWV